MYNKPDQVIQKEGHYEKNALTVLASSSTGARLYRSSYINYNNYMLVICCSKMNKNLINS